MAFDPFGGGGAPQGSHVVFAPASVAFSPHEARPQAVNPVAPSQRQASFGDVMQQALAQAPQAGATRSFRASAEEVAGALGKVVFVLDGIASPRPRPDQNRLNELEARRQEAQRQEVFKHASAEVMTEQAMDSMSGSSSTSIANRLPGSPGDAYRYMETLRHDEQMVEERREVARKMAQKDDEMAYRD